MTRISAGTRMKWRFLVRVRYPLVRCRNLGPAREPQKRVPKSQTTMPLRSLEFARNHRPSQLRLISIRDRSTSGVVLHNATYEVVSVMRPMEVEISLKVELAVPSLSLTWSESMSHVATQLPNDPFTIPTTIAVHLGMNLTLRNLAIGIALPFMPDQVSTGRAHTHTRLMVCHRCSDVIIVRCSHGCRSHPWFQWA